MFIWENWSPWFDYFDYMPWTLDCISISCGWAEKWAELVVFWLPLSVTRTKLDTPSHGLVVSTLKTHIPGKDTIGTFTAHQSIQSRLLSFDFAMLLRFFVGKAWGSSLLHPRGMAIIDLITNSVQKSRC